MLNSLNSQTLPLQSFSVIFPDNVNLGLNSKLSSKMLKSVSENKLNSQFPEILDCQKDFSKVPFFEKPIYRKKVNFPKYLISRKFVFSVKTLSNLFYHLIFSSGIKQSKITVKCRNLYPKSNWTIYSRF